MASVPEQPSFFRQGGVSVKSDQAAGTTPATSNPSGTKASEPFSDLAMWDWLFLFFTWLTIWWLSYGISSRLSNPDFDFNYMPVVAGVPTILLGWRATRVGNGISVAIKQLHSSAALMLQEGDSIAAIDADLKASASRWAAGCAAVVVGLMLVALTALFASGTLAFGSNVSVRLLSIVLCTVTVGTGGVLGYLFGRLVGLGRLLTMMKNRRISFFFIMTSESRKALGDLTGVYRFSIAAAVVIYHWFAIWVFAWELGYALKYRSAYGTLFTILLGVSFLFFVMAAWLPTRALNRYLNSAYSRRRARAIVERQVSEAAEDYLAVAHTPTGQETRADLKAFIAEKRAQLFVPLLLSDRFLNSILAWLGFLLALAEIFLIRG